MKTLPKQLTSIAQTLAGIRLQIADSIPFANDYLGSNNTIEGIWRLLKANTRFQHDPKGIELLQSMQTLLTDANEHGRRGYGDCDCFTIAACASLLSRGIPCKIVLAGNSQGNWTHIYALAKSKAGWVPFDLTNDYLGEERKYRYTHEISVKPSL